MAKAIEQARNALRVGRQLFLFPLPVFPPLRCRCYMASDLGRWKGGVRRNNILAFLLCLDTFPISSVKDCEPTLQRKNLRLSEVA